MVVAEEITTVIQPAVTEEVSTKPSKRTRKRAADFLYDAPEDDSPKPKKGKKEARAPAKEQKSLTADGTNGVVEHSDDEGVSITTTKQPKKKSMMAEAERTQDAELADEYGSDKDGSEEDIDTAPALLTGFDSDNEDAAEDKDFDASRLGAIPQFKKTSKKLRKAKESKSDGPGVVYIGRVPHGFYETQMREYFSQFGTITRLRLSRNKKTGASKHFAFVEFDSNEVAKIVADTMDNYLMFGHILKCKYAPAENLHADVWKGANKKYRKIPQHKLLKQKAEQPKTDEQIEKKMKKVQGKREKKLKQLTEMGYDYELPTLVKPSVSEIAPQKEEQPAIEDKVEGALVPPPNVPKDELAVKVEEKQKKAKKDKSKKQDQTSEEIEPAATEKNTATVAEAPKKTSKKGKKDAAPIEIAAIVADEIVPTEEPRKSKRSKKETATKTAPVITEEVAVEVAKPAKKSKKGKKDEAVVEVAPVVAEQTIVVADESVPKKSKKGKKEVVIEPTPAVEEIPTVTEEAPKKSKKGRKDIEVVEEVKVDKKQLKSILKKTKKA